MKFSAKRIAVLGVFTALSVLLIYFIRIPAMGATFLEYDPADVPIFFITFLAGTTDGLILTVLVSIIQGVTVSAGSNFIGILMHIFATGGYVLVAGLINKKKQNVYLASAIGSLCMVVSMILWNLIFTPIFLGAPIDAVIALLPVIILFNVIKAGVNSILAVALFKSAGKPFGKIYK